MSPVAVRRGLLLSLACCLWCGLLPLSSCRAGTQADSLLLAVAHDHDHGHVHDHLATSAKEAGQESHGHEGTSGGLAWLLLGYSLLIAAASLLGGWIPGRVQLTHLRFQLLLSLVGGLMLGIGVFHLWTHALHELGHHRADLAANWVMGGMMLMFFLLRAFHVHHHEPPADVGDMAEQPASLKEVPLPALPILARGHQHDHDCDHDSRGGSPAARGSSHQWSWVGIFFGLAIHTLLDGLALGATMVAEAGHGGGMFVGLGIMLAIVLHKPLDSLSITSLMLKGGWSARNRWVVNVVYALLCPLAAAAFLFGVGRMTNEAHTLVGCSLAFSAGVFICIALTDLLPEMQFHSHHRWRLSLSLVLGVVLAWAIQFLEPAHLHH